MKKTIIVDIDGVILNFAQSFARWWNDKFPDEVSLPENPSNWQFEHPNLNLVLKRIEEYTATCETYPLMEPEIARYLEILAKKYRIHLMTAFPERYRDSRIANLALYNISYDELTFADGHKIDLVRKIDPAALIEDSPKNIMDFVTHNYPVYVPRYWNYSKDLQHGLITFYDNWGELVAMIDH